ncbi:MAG: hypothetical protein ABIN39_05515 [candidate division WOR-3 bacterium]
MNSIYFYSTIISIICVYILGNLNRVLRNVFVSVFLVFSFLYFYSIDSTKLTINFFGFESLNLNFSKTDFSYSFLILNHILFFFFILRELFRSPRESENSYFMNICFIFALLNIIFVSNDFITIYIFFEILFFILVITLTINLNDYKSSENILLVNLFGSLLLLSVIVVITSNKSFSNYPSFFYIVLYISVALRTLVLPLSTFFKKELTKSDFNFIGIFTMSIFLSGFFIMGFLYNNFLISQHILPNISKFFIYLFFLLTLFVFSIESLISNDLKLSMFNFSGAIFVTNLLIFLYYSDFSFGYLINVILYFIPLTFIFVFFDYIEDKFKTSNFNFLFNLFYLKPISSFVIILSLLSLSFLYPTMGFYLFREPLFNLSYNSFPIFFVFLIYLLFYISLTLKLLYLLFIQKSNISETKTIKSSEFLISVLTIPFLIPILCYGILKYVNGYSSFISHLIFGILGAIILLLLLKLKDDGYNPVILPTSNSEEYFYIHGRKNSIIGDLLNFNFDLSPNQKVLQSFLEKTDLNKIFYSIKVFLEDFSLTILKLYQRSFSATIFILLIFFIFLLIIFYRGNL